MKRIILFFPFAVIIGCATVHTAGTDQIDALIASGDLSIHAGDSPKVIALKKEVAPVITQARKEIVAATTTATAEKLRADKNENWSLAGKIMLAVIIGLVVIILIIAIVRFVSWVTGLR